MSGVRMTGKAAAVAAVAAVFVSSCGFNSVYDVPLPGGADVGDDPMTLTIEFRDVLDLVPESAVKLDDVTVGKVTDIEMEDWHAVVTVQVRDSAEVPANAQATIRQTSILGEKFVSLEEPANPSEEQLDSGDEIPMSRTGNNPEIEEVLGALSMVLNGGGVAQLQTITEEMNRVFAGREEDVQSVIRRLGTFMADIDRQKPEIVEALHKIDQLGRNANEQTDAIESALDEVPDAIRVLHEQRDDFVRMLGKLDRFSDVGTSVIRRSRADTVANLRALAPVLENLNRSGDSLVSSLRLLLTAPYPDSLVGETPEEALTYEGGSFINAELTFDADLQTNIEDLTPAEYRRLRKVLSGPAFRKSDEASPEAHTDEARSDGLARLMLEGGEAQ